jgi:type IV secretory pathway component VirB8
MLSKNVIKWLKKELPELVEKEMITPYQSEQLWEYYRHKWTLQRRKALKLILIATVTIMVLCIAIAYLL